MSKAEVEALSDEDLIKAWNEIKAAFQANLPPHLSKQQGLIFFADFVNVSGEMSKRNLDK